MYAVILRPDVFGKALSESGAFWVPGRATDDAEPEWLARYIARVPRSNASFYLTVGSNEYTVAGETTLLASNRHLRDILQLKGYAYRYVEIPGDHEPINWRRALPPGLIAVLGG
jgi:enterochelin esterase family protein